MTVRGAKPNRNNYTMYTQHPKLRTSVFHGCRPQLGTKVLDSWTGGRDSILSNKLSILSNKLSSLSNMLNMISNKLNISSKSRHLPNKT